MVISCRRILVLLKLILQKLRVFIQMNNILNTLDEWIINDVAYGVCCYYSLNVSHGYCNGKLKQSRAGTKREIHRRNLKIEECHVPFPFLSSSCLVSSRTLLLLCHYHNRASNTTNINNIALQ